MNEQILRELRNHSNSVFNRLNIELSEVLKRNFNELLEDSVNRMERERRTSSSDIETAKSAYTTFINQMYSHREKRIGQKDIVRYQSLTESKSSLCPLWPIC
ncbi:hypothetical protein [Flagellimonas pacifica]|uniref:Uncharacterized protein n=1 Tax=Flagellimonas pacifica TaxID=1247520 RepID=A0A285MXA4_9FLAO|nr:hypothetical protein [Allomuricauda parva]SNZ01728.1 hypothetical protein SAMN06265377_3570 [Allomuricauda parva]